MRRSAVTDWKSFKELETGGIILENLVALEGGTPKFVDREDDEYYGSYHVHPEHGPLKGATWQGEESREEPLYPIPNDYQNPDQAYFRSILNSMLRETYPYFDFPDNKLPSELLQIQNNQAGEVTNEAAAELFPVIHYTTRNDKGVLILDEEAPDAVTNYALGLTRLVTGDITDEILDREFDFFEPEDAPDADEGLSDSNLFYATAFEGDWHEIWLRKELPMGSDGYSTGANTFECFYVEDGVYRNIPDWKTLEVMLSERGQTYENVIRLGKREEIDQEWRRPSGAVGDYVLPSRASEWSQYTKANAGYEPTAPFTRDPVDYAIYETDGTFSGEFKDSVFSTGQTYLEKQRVRFENQMINPNGDERNIRIMLKGVWRKLPVDGTEREDGGTAGSGDLQAKAIIEMYVADKWPDYLKYDKKYSSYGLIREPQDNGGLGDSPVFFNMKTAWGGEGGNYPEGVRIWNDFEHRDDFLTFDEYKDYLQKFNDCWNQPHLIAAGEPAGSVKYYDLTYDEADITAPRSMTVPDSETGATYNTLLTEEANTWSQGIAAFVEGGRDQLRDKYAEIEGLYSLALSVIGEEGEKINGKLKAYAEKTNARFGMKKRRKKFNYDWPPASNYRKKGRTKGSIKEVVNASWKRWDNMSWLSPKATRTLGNDSNKAGLKKHFKYDGSLGQLTTNAQAQMEDIKYAYNAAQEVLSDGADAINEWYDEFVEQFEDTINNISDSDQAESYFGETFTTIEEIVEEFTDNLTEIYSDMSLQLKQYVDLDQELFEAAESHIASFVNPDNDQFSANWKDRVRFKDWWLGSGNNNPDNVSNNDDSIDLATVSRPKINEKVNSAYQELVTKLDNQG